jgi:hypothetical protein
LAAGAQHRLGARHFMRRRPDVHARVMQDEILEHDELAGEPEAGAGVLEMRPADETLSDRARSNALVEPGERVFGGGEWILQRRPWRRFAKHGVFQIGRSAGRRSVLSGERRRAIAMIPANEK